MHVDSSSPDRLLQNKNNKPLPTLSRHLSMDGQGSSSLSWKRTNIPLLTSAFLAALTTGGTTYAFGLYGAALKRTLSLSQSQLDTISSANFCAGLLSWIPGLCVDRFGARVALSGGGILSCVALLSYWAVARQFVPVHHALVVPTLSTFGVLIFFASALITGSVFKIIVVSCGPGSKGSAVGCAKGLVGLGAGAYSCLFEAIRGSHESDLDFLPMAAFFSAFACTVPALSLLPAKSEMLDHTPQDVTTPLHFRALYVGLAALATFVVATSVMELESGEPGNLSSDARANDGPHYLRALLILFAWIGPIISLLFWPHATHEAVDLEEHVDEQETQQQKEERVLDSLLSEEVLPDSSAENEPASLPQDRSLFQMLRTLSAWLMAWTCVILVGAGTIMTNNMGQMVESLRFQSLVAPASLALFSVAQAGARVATGAISESALTWNTSLCEIEQGVPRPAFLVVASLFGLLAHTLLAATQHEPTFVFGVAMSGAAFGMVWPLMVLIVGDVFGTANHGANYMFYDGFTSAMGTLLLSKFVAQKVYEDHIDQQNDDSDGRTCYGTACFCASHLIVAGLALTCVVSSVAMVFTTRSVYDRQRARVGIRNP